MHFLIYVLDPSTCSSAPLYHHHMRIYVHFMLKIVDPTPLPSPILSIRKGRWICMETGNLNPNFQHMKWRASSSVKRSIQIVVLCRRSTKNQFKGRTEEIGGFLATGIQGDRDRNIPRGCGKEHCSLALEFVIITINYRSICW